MPLPVSSAAFAVLAAGLVTATVIDLRTRRIPNRLTAAMAGNGTGAKAVEAWVAPRKAEVERIRMAVNEIANSGLTLSKLSVAASLLGDLAKN